MKTQRILAMSFAALLSLGLLSHNPSAPMTTVKAQEVTAGRDDDNAFERAKKRSCVAAALAGRFSYIFDGTLGTTPLKAVGVLTVNADGTLAFADTVSVSGQIQRRTFTGTFTLNADCTASAQFSTGTSADLVVDDNGNGLKIVLTTPGTMITGIGRRIFDNQ